MSDSDVFLSELQGLKSSNPTNLGLAACCAVGAMEVPVEPGDARLCGLNGEKKKGISLTDEGIQCALKKFLISIF